jgi:hypothetical protein
MIVTGASGEPFTGSPSAVRLGQVGVGAMVGGSGMIEPQPAEIPIKSDMIRMGGRSIEALLLNNIFYPFYPLSGELRM